jgi:hypothetical protein
MCRSSFFDDGFCRGNLNSYKYNAAKKSGYVIRFHRVKYDKKYIYICMYKTITMDFLYF